MIVETLGKVCKVFFLGSVNKMIFDCSTGLTPLMFFCAPDSL